MGHAEATTPDAVITDLERQRLRALVEGDYDAADALHAEDFQLVHPSGGVWSKQQYLGGIATGSIDYRRFEPVSDIEVMVGDSLAVIRYQSAIEIKVEGREADALRCWHVDCYRRDRDAARWQVVWSHATEVVDPVDADA